MKPLDLDFRRTRPASAWGGWLLLAIAAAFTVDLVYSWQAARAALAQTEARLAQQARSGGGPARAAPGRRPVSADEIKLARETMQRLQLPWDPLFGALEGAANNRIALAAIEPDPKSGTVVISGQAESYPAVLDYVVQLRRTRALAGAHLVKYEVRPDDPQRPVAFAVSASWGGKS
ncbi:MAG TPA: hypothetical protein VMN03_00595 [Burkholderiales bacterium]|nr:hypothetical protein [Burkholderiales bacterium]